MMTKYSWTATAGAISASAIVLLFGSHLPLEQEIVNPFGPSLFICKSIVFFLALLIPISGLGNIIYRSLGLVTFYLDRRSLLASRDEKNSFVLASTTLWAISLGGLVAVGLLTFLSGLMLPPSYQSAFLLLLPGYCGLWLEEKVTKRSPLILRWPSLAFAELKEQMRANKWLIGLFLAVLFFRSFSVFSFQSHGDAYLYHLALADSWIREGHTGVVLHNIYSGYALAIEHFYLLLKLLFSGHAEQNALAQMFHFFVGYGLFFWSLQLLCRHWLTPTFHICLGILLLQPKFMFFAALPKNDAFLAGVCMLAYVSLLRRHNLLFFLCAATALSIKATAAMPFIGAGLTILGLAVWRSKATKTKELLYRPMLVLITGMSLMFLVWSPFAIHNFIVTGNPLFPLLNELFKSPYAPSSVKHILPEMNPLSLSFRQFIGSLGSLLITHPLFCLGLLCFPLACFRSRSLNLSLQKDKMTQTLVPTLIFCLLTFLLIQLASGTYTTQMEARHYLVVLGPLLAIALSFVYSLAATMRQGKWLTVLVFILAISGTSLDVSITRALEDVFSDNLTKDIFVKKPVMAIYHQLDQGILKAGTQSNYRVLALSGTNVSYFLSGGELWHKTKTWPLWAWDLEAFTKQDWQMTLQDHRIRYVLLDDRFSSHYKTLLDLKNRILLENGPYILMDFESITERVPIDHTL